MFNYSLKTKITIILFFLGLTAGIVMIVAFGFSRAQDINIVSEAKVLATALERYYDKFQSYPLIQKTAVGNIMILSDQGPNQNGEIVYFKKNTDWLDRATIASDGQNYVISFELARSWRPLGIDSFAGGTCLLTTNVILKCQ